MKHPSIKRNLLWVVLGMTLLSQLAFVPFCLDAFRQRYRQAVGVNLRTAGLSLKNNLEYILQKRVPWDRLSGMDKLLGELLEDIPAIGSITLYDDAGQWRFYADRRGIRTWREERSASEALVAPGPTVAMGKAESLKQVVDLVGPQGVVVGKMVLTEQHELVQHIIGGMILDSVTVMLVSLVAIIDLVLFLVVYSVTLPLECAARSLRGSPLKSSGGRSHNAEPAFDPWIVCSLVLCDKKSTIRDSKPR
jgi:hypothetical protein